MQPTVPLSDGAAMLPVDHRKLLLDEETMRGVFTARAAELADGRRILQDCVVLGATKKLRKLIVEYRLRVRAHDGGGVEEIPVIGKAYAQDRGAYAHAAMAALFAGEFSSNCGYAVPRPIAYLPEWCLLLQGKASGVQLSALLPYPGRGLEGARQAARWLARLHQSDLPLAAFSVADSRERLERFAHDLAGPAPSYGRAVSGLTARLVALLGEPGAQTLRPTHGDYHPKNVFLDGTTVTVIDFDTFAQGEAARDLGYFIAQCAIMAYHKRQSFASAVPPSRIFLEAYQAEGLSVDTGRVALYVVRAFLQSLHYELCVLRTGNHALVPVWVDQMAAWLDYAARPVTPLPFASWR